MYFLVILFLLFARQTFSQQKRTINTTVINLPNYDEHRLHFGMSLGLNFPNFKIKHSDYFVQSDSVRSVLSPRKFGITIGMITNTRLAEYFDLRGLVIVSLNERVVAYEFKNGEHVDQNFESASVEVPLLLKFKSDRRKNRRMYLIGGIKPSIELASGKKNKKTSELRTQNYDLTIEYGIGTDKYYPYFKWAPEIRFSHGLFNMLVKDNNVYSRSIKRMTTHSVSLYFNLE